MALLEYVFAAEVAALRLRDSAGCRSDYNGRWAARTGRIGVIVRVGKKRVNTFEFSRRAKTRTKHEFASARYWETCVLTAL
jgi:hypothetical protein